MLVATDIAARGVHVDEVAARRTRRPARRAQGLPASLRAAPHARAAAGDVVTVVLPEQRRDASALLRRAGIAVHPQQVTAQSDSVTKLVGDVAPYQAPAAKPASAPHTQPRSRRSTRGGRTPQQHRAGTRGARNR